jgi:GntR family transcriptional regulator
VNWCWRAAARQGRGTVVAGPKLEQPLSLASYTEGVRRQGRTPGRSLVTLDRFPCPEALAAETGLTRGEPVWHLERVLLADDERVGLESTYVSVARIPRLDADFEPDSSFYAYLGTSRASPSATPTNASRRCSPPRARPSSSAPRPPFRCC